MKHLLNKSDQQKVEFLDYYEESGESGYTCYLNKGYWFNGENGASFSEDTLKDIKAALKHRVVKDWDKKLA